MGVKLSEMTIDVWMQHPTKRFLAHDMFDSLRRWTGEAIPEEPPSIDVTVAAMDAAKVRFGLLSAWHGPGGPLIANDEVAAWIEQHPDRFAGLAAVDLDKPMEAVRELRRCVGELGFAGLRVIPWLWEAPPTDRRYYPLYAACVELGVPFCTQVGHTGPLKPSETGRPIPYIDQVAIDFPELTIIGGLGGWPWVNEMVAIVRRHPKLSMDTSAHRAKYLGQPGAGWEMLMQMGNTLIQDKVLIGLSAGLVGQSYDTLIGEYLALPLKDSVKDKWLYHNAARVFGIA
jgi:uncharacterized protein